MSRALDTLYGFIKERYPSSQYPLIHQQIQEWTSQKPLQGLSVLQNIPLTDSTIIKTLPLIASEANVTVTHFAMQALQPSKNAIDALKQAGVNYEADHQKIRGTFNIGLDCGAQILGMPQVKITDGIVELTQTGGKLFKKTPLPFPIIDVNHSYLKNLEGMYGTGDGFVRAIKYFCKTDLQGEQFVVFGYGKVGRGIAKYLQYEKANIIIVEASEQQKDSAESNHLKVLLATETDRIREAISNAFCVCTATGQKNVVCRYADPTDYPNTWFANMGVVDEIGGEKNSPNILCNRSPINFSLKNPTQIKYLDPIFYAHNVSAALLREYRAGYHVFPEKIDRAIINQWENFHNKKVNDIYETKEMI